jgi:hypothetical protein
VRRCHVILRRPPSVKSMSVNIRVSESRSRLGTRVRNRYAYLSAKRQIDIGDALSGLLGRVHIYTAAVS